MKQKLTSFLLLLLTVVGIASAYADQHFTYSTITQTTFGGPPQLFTTIHINLESIPQNGLITLPTIQIALAKDIPTALNASFDCSALTGNYVPFILDQEASNLDNSGLLSKDNDYGPLVNDHSYYGAAAYCNFPGQGTLYYVGTIPAYREYYFGPLIPAQKVTVEIPILVL